MDPVYDAASQDQETLRAQLRQAREILDGLVGDLNAVDGELEKLLVERQQVRLLQDVCGALEELSAQGAAGLFWGEGTLADEGDAHVRRGLARVNDFEKRLSEVESRRQEIVEEIEQANVCGEFIEDDIFELQREEEERKREWIIEREVDTLPFQSLVMPWTRGGEDDQRFQKSLAAALLVSLLLGLVFPIIDLPLPELWKAVDVPERFTRLVRDERPVPPPPPEEPRLAEKEPEETKPPVTPEPTPKPQPKPRQETASKGILAFREKFSALADAKPTAKLGAQARIQPANGVTGSRTQRSLVGLPASASGGIDVSSLSRDIGVAGSGEITGVEVARATSSIGALTGPERPLSDGPGLSRTDEEIQIVFDRHKAALYRLYNRELRRDPTLTGQMVLRMTIEADGRVSLCEIESSDMRAPKLASQVVARVGTFNFGAKAVPAITILYPIDFLPAT